MRARTTGRPGAPCGAIFVSTPIYSKPSGPEEERLDATTLAKHLIVPEFTVIGWMAREIKATIPHPERVIAGPRVGGGMTMPPEIIVEEIKKAIGIRSAVLAGRGS